MGDAVGKRKMVFKNSLLQCLGVEIISSSHWLWGYEVVPILENEKHPQKNIGMIVLDGKL
jgi:hypothetical protein